METDTYRTIDKTKSKMTSVQWMEIKYLGRLFIGHGNSVSTSMVCSCLHMKLCVDRQKQCMPDRQLVRYIIDAVNGVLIKFGRTTLRRKYCFGVSHINHWLWTFRIILAWHQRMDGTVLLLSASGQLTPRASILFSFLGAVCNSAAFAAHSAALVLVPYHCSTGTVPEEHSSVVGERRVDYCTVLYCRVLYCRVLYCTVLPAEWLHHNDCCCICLPLHSTFVGLSNARTNQSCLVTFVLTGNNKSFFYTTLLLYRCIATFFFLDSTLLLLLLLQFHPIQQSSASSSRSSHQQGMIACKWSYSFPVTNLPLPCSTPEEKTKF